MKDEDCMPNCEDSNQSASRGAEFSWSALFAQTRFVRKLRIITVFAILYQKCVG